MRFVDPQYGFVTPRARFFTISYNQQKVESVRMSPQVETLSLDDALKVVLDLQEQWKKGGWTPINLKREPLFVDTPHWRKGMEECKTNMTFWQASDWLQTQLNIACFDDSNHPNEQRYLITLELSKPWVTPDEKLDLQNLRPIRPLEQ